MPMGTQGEIYSVLGLKLPAKEVSKKGIYDVGGKRVAIDDMVDEPHDFVHGINYEKGRAELSFYLLGFDSSFGMGPRHFQNEALVGYAIANESYMNSATKLPDLEKIESLREKLAMDLYQKLDMYVELNDLGLYLLFDFIN